MLEQLWLGALTVGLRPSLRVETPQMIQDAMLESIFRPRFGRCLFLPPSLPFSASYISQNAFQ